MSFVGDPIRRNITASDLFRTVINEINELKNKFKGGEAPPRTLYIADIGKVLLSHTEPTITTTTSATAVYDSTDVYETGTYS